LSKLPIIERHLIKYLETIYPDVSPSLSIPDRELWAQVGAVGVVRHLRSLYEEQNETIYSNE